MPTLRQELLDQHARLDDSLNGLACAAEGADRAETLRVWGELERDLLHHLDLEERELFPLVEPFQKEAIDSLRLEHGRIRTIVAELGVRAELHTLRKHTVDWLVEALRRHAEREDRTLYRWVEELAPEDTRRHLASLFARTARADLRAGAGHRRKRIS
jgi:hemerythrin-like domain-containing protein